MLGEVPNPLYTPGADGTPARSPDLVFLAGIIGVPWQDIATADEPDEAAGSRYLTASEMVRRVTDGKSVRPEPLGRDPR